MKQSFRRIGKGAYSESAVGLPGNAEYQFEISGRELKVGPVIP